MKLKYIPSDSFIGKYMQMASALETSQSYDFWSACWVLGTCVGRGVYVPRPHAPVYLNWYCMLVAESGVTRKSTAVRMARDIVSHHIGVDHMVEGKSTPTYLFERLSRTPHLAVNVSELVTFLGKETYMIDLPALLTDLYDCPEQRQAGSSTKGAMVIDKPYLTFLSASTPSWLLGAVNPSVIEGGFTSRCMFILDEAPKRRISWPEDVHGKEDVYDTLAETVRRAQAVATIDLLPAARRRFDTWYRQRDIHTDSAFLASFLAREDSHVLRMAATLAINDDTLAIDRKHIDQAIKLIAQAKASGLTIFTGGGAVIKLANGIDRIIKMLVEAGGTGVGHTPMYAGCRHFMSSNDFKVVVDYMHELNMLAVAIENRPGGGRKGVRYFRTPDTVSKDAYRMLRDHLL